MRIDCQPSMQIREEENPTTQYAPKRKQKPKPK